MKLEELRARKLELETKISQSIFEILTGEGDAPDKVTVAITKNKTIEGREEVAAVYVDVEFML